MKFADNLTTELYYSAADNKYALMKNGSIKNDLLNSNICYFDNCIILFSDTVTYENEFGKEIDIDVDGPGKGFYFTNGSYTPITYSSADDQGLCFYDSVGEKLKINRGKTYIGYMKSSMYENFKNTISN